MLAVTWTEVGGSAVALGAIIALLTVAWRAMAYLVRRIDWLSDQMQANGAADPTTHGPGEGTAGDALGRVESRQIEQADEMRTMAAAVRRIGEELRLSIKRDDERLAAHSERIHGAEDGLRRHVLDRHVHHPPQGEQS